MDELGIETLEKPHVGCPPCAEKLPLVLSSLGSAECIQVPASIAQYLRDYQREGVRFLYARYEANEGGILADDMGLGKTIQSIAFISAVLRMTGTAKDKLRHCMDFIKRDTAQDFRAPSVLPVLIICPASLTENWVLELQTWAHFKILKYQKKMRSSVLKKAKLQECDVVIATLEMARTDIADLKSVPWTAVIVDEVHRIKDPVSQLTKALSTFACKYRYGLTGTPLQNNLRELWCLLNWANPNCLGDLATFTNNIIRVIELGQRHSATKRELAEARLARMKLATLRNRFMLRRTKVLLQDQLPHKTDQVVFCELTQLQSDIYRRIVESPDVQTLLAQLTERGCGPRVKPGTLFTYMHLLLKAANHLGLLMSSASQDSLAHQICEDVLGGHSKEDLLQVNMSGKMRVLSKLLDRFMDQGDKVLLFSRSTVLLNLIQKYLQQKRYKHYRLDGATATDTRCALVHTFNVSSHPSVFLLSIKAGGVGLNITGANVVIIFDPNWNPALDLQAQDRAYRIGQLRDVRVYRLLSTSTIEELIYLRQLYKQQLATVAMSNENARRYFTSVPGDTRYHGELFGVRNIFSFRENNRSVTEEILERQQHLEIGIMFPIEAPKLDDTGVNIAPYALKTDDLALSGKRSGLLELVSDIDGNVQFEGQDEDERNSETDEEREEGDEVLENIIMETDQAPESTLNVLNASEDIQYVIKHTDIVGGSRAEDFMVKRAMEDVLEKGINSQHPAFHCGTTPKLKQLLHGNVSSAYSSSALRRLIFNKMAEEMSLTPYEFGIKVLSMSDEEKVALLGKHAATYPDPEHKKLTEMKKDYSRLYKRQRKQAEIKSSTDQEASSKNTEPSKPVQVREITVAEKPSVPESTYVERNSRTKSGKLHPLGKRNLRHLSRTESIDMVVSQCSIPISHHSAAKMDELFLNSEGPVKPPPRLSNTSNKIELQSNASLIDSLFFSDRTGKDLLSNQKGNFHTEKINSMKTSTQKEKCGSESRPLKSEYEAVLNSSAQVEEFLEKTFFGEVDAECSLNEGLKKELPEQSIRSPSVTSTTYSSILQPILDFSQPESKNAKSNSSKESLHYPAEDDIFQKLLTSGKLKRL